MAGIKEWQEAIHEWAIRKEWRWRAERGHDMRNLRAFAHLVEPRDEG